MRLEIKGLDGFKKIVNRLDNDIMKGLSDFTDLLGEEARFFVQGRLDGDYPNPDGIRLINKYYHPELGREVDHLTVEHTKTGRLRDNIDIVDRSDGFDIVASAIDPFTGEDYAVSVIEDDHKQGGMNYLDFAPLKIGEDLESGKMLDIFKKSFKFLY